MPSNLPPGRCGHYTCSIAEKQARGDADELDDDDSDAWVTDDGEDGNDMAVDGSTAGTGGKPSAAGEEDPLARYNLDTYDDDDDDDAGGALMAGTGMGNGVAGLLYHAPGEEDPYITLKNDPEDDEIEDFRIRPTDNLVVCGQTEDVYSHLEVQVYDEADHHLYVHHDLMLASYPLCLEWMDFDPAAEKGNKHRLVL